MDRIEQAVLEKIKSGKIAKRPRLYFVLQSIAIVVLALIVLALSIFVLSFIFFSIHEGGEQFLLGFGERGLITFIRLFPWFSLALLIFLLGVLEWLVRTFRSGYSLPMLRIFFGLAAAAVLGGILLAITPLNPLLLQAADRDGLPLLGPAYENIHTTHEHEGVFRGYVISVATSTFTMTYDDRDRDTDDGTWLVEVPQNFDLSSLAVGARVFVAGQGEPGGVVRAYGVQQF